MIVQATFIYAPLRSPGTAFSSMSLNEGVRGPADAVAAASEVCRCLSKECLSR